MALHSISDIFSQDAVSETRRMQKSRRRAVSNVKKEQQLMRSTMNLQSTGLRKFLNLNLVP